jgi:dipeptidyl aminopeptidase/acylaminoacyl peptidase
MHRDIRTTDLFKEIEETFRKANEPAFDKISGATGPAISPDGRVVAFTGTKVSGLDLKSSSRVCSVSIEGGEVTELTSGPNDDRMPRWSPDGQRISFLSDRKEKGQFLLYLLESGSLGEARPTPPVDGTIEYHHWSPDGTRILLGVAGRGADLSGGQGSGTTKKSADDLPSWLPTIDSGVSAEDWRRLALYEVEGKSTQIFTRDGLNVWEATWAGPDHVAAIVSDGDPTENGWYTAPLALIDARTGQERILYRSEWQLGVPAASTSGRRLAVIEACCSDRWLVAGDLLLVDPQSGATTRIDTAGVDVTYMVWRNEERLVYGGIRGLHTVFGEYDAVTGGTRELWESDGGCGIYFPEPVSSIALVDDDSFVVLRDGYVQYPELALVRNGQARPITSLRHAGADFLVSISGQLEEVSWRAPDGRDIQGLLVTPVGGSGPYPMVVDVHGGPVHAWQSRWGYLATTRWLASRGYAVLHPNPRGSSGRGQEFARLVRGEMGGDDTDDILSGIDAMVQRGIADPSRIGVTGGSYGGFMSSWLVTQDNRFAAAVSVAPVTDWISFHGTSNIGLWNRMFLQDGPENPAGKYSQRSPVIFSRNVKTPTLNIAGMVDRCTPFGQAVEFHTMLLEHGVESELVLYPEEGHGVRAMPAVLDYVTRTIDWFEKYMPAKSQATAHEEKIPELAGLK